MNSGSVDETKPPVLDEELGGVRRKFIRNLLNYGGANLIAQGFQFVQGVTIRALLPPSVVGNWNYVGVTAGFMNTFDLGITAGASRELPLLRGAGKTDEEDLARSTAFWGRLIQSVGFAAIILGVTTLGYRDAVWNVALTAAVLLILGSCVESYTCFYQSAENYVFLGWANIIGVVLMFVGVVTGGYVAGASGIMVGAIAAMAVKLYIFVGGRGGDGSAVTPTLNGAVLKRLIGFGLPMRLMDYPLSLLTMLDVLVISSFLMPAELGIYTTAKIITMMAIEGLAKLNIVYLSRLYIRSGEKKDRHEIAVNLRAFVLAQYSIVLPLAVIGAWWAAKIMIGGLLPHYEVALETTRWLLLVAFVVPQTSLLRNFWMIDKRFKSIGIVNACGLAGMGLLLGALLLQGKLSLEHVAQAYVAGFTLHFLILMVTVGREVWGWRQTLKVALTALGAMAYTGGIIMMISAELEIKGLWGMLQASALPALSSLALLLPLAWAGWRWSGVRNLRP